MAIPSFDQRGLLPSNSDNTPYTATLEDLRIRFATNDIRQWIWGDFLSWLRAVRTELDVELLWIGGSYITDKERPSDIDVVAWLEKPSVEIFAKRRLERPLASLRTHQYLKGGSARTPVVFARIQPANDHVDGFFAPRGNPAQAASWRETWSGVYDKNAGTRIGDKGFLEVRL